MKENMTPITGKYKVCGVIGDPITHTLSPVIHNQLAEVMGEEMIYVPFHVTPSGLEEAIKGAYALGIKGLNITMPHKQDLLKYITEIDTSARMAGAINTIVYGENGYKGYNTDYTGLQMSLEEAGIEWKDKNVAIIGSGGAAYAAYVCVAKEARSIHVFNRTLSNAEALKKHMKSYFNTPTFVYDKVEGCQKKLDLVIQTTGIGMGKHIGEMPNFSEWLLRDAKAAVDLIYHPRETAFLNAAKSKGCKIVNGFGMLYYQAVKAFELMHGTNCPQEIILNIKRELSKYMED